MGRFEKIPPIVMYKYGADIKKTSNEFKLLETVFIFLWLIYMRIGLIETCQTLVFILLFDCVIHYTILIIQMPEKDKAGIVTWFEKNGLSISLVAGFVFICFVSLLAYLFIQWQKLQK